MKKEIADKWIAALRSGDYKQGKGALRKKDDTYCCLGVLCAILGIEAREPPPTGNVYTFGVDRNFGVLPTEAIVAAGMHSCDGIVGTMSLSIMNDAFGGYSFNDIANVIEREWKSL